MSAPSHLSVNTHRNFSPRIVVKDRNILSKGTTVLDKYVDGRRGLDAASCPISGLRHSCIHGIMHVEMLGNLQLGHPDYTVDPFAWASCILLCALLLASFLRQRRGLLVQRATGRRGHPIRLAVRRLIPRTWALDPPSARACISAFGSLDAASRTSPSVPSAASLMTPGPARYPPYLLPHHHPHHPHHPDHHCRRRIRHPQQPLDDRRPFLLSSLLSSISAIVSFPRFNPPNPSNTFSLLS